MANRFQPVFCIQVADLVAGAILVNPKIQIPSLARISGNPLLKLALWNHNEMLLMSEGENHKHPQVSQTLADLGGFQAKPTRCNNMPSKVFTNVKTARELQLEADGFALVSFACDQEIHAAVFRSNPNVKLSAEFSINVIAD